MKGTKIYSIVKGRCPRCQEAPVFAEANPYRLKSMFRMNEHCAHCGLRFELEPNFYYGSMYVSYGYSVAVFVATYVILGWFIDPGISDIVLALSLILLVSMPYIFRISRLTWLNLFVKYNPEKRGPSVKG